MSENNELSFLPAFSPADNKGNHTHVLLCSIYTTYDSLSSNITETPSHEIAGKNKTQVKEGDCRFNTFLELKKISLTANSFVDSKKFNITFFSPSSETRCRHGQCQLDNNTTGRDGGRSSRFSRNRMDQGRCRSTSGFSNPSSRPSLAIGATNSNFCGKEMHDRVNFLRGVHIFRMTRKNSFIYFDLMAVIILNNGWLLFFNFTNLEFVTAFNILSNHQITNKNNKRKTCLCMNNSGGSIIYQRCEINSEKYSDCYLFDSFLENKLSCINLDKIVLNTIRGACMKITNNYENYITHITLPNEFSYLHVHLTIPVWQAILHTQGFIKKENSHLSKILDVKFFNTANYKMTESALTTLTDIITPNDVLIISVCKDRTCFLLSLFCPRENKNQSFRLIQVFDIGFSPNYANVVTRMNRSSVSSFHSYSSNTLIENRQINITRGGFDMLQSLSITAQNAGISCIDFNPSNGALAILTDHGRRIIIMLLDSSYKNNTENNSIESVCGFDFIRYGWIQACDATLKNNNIVQTSNNMMNVPPFSIESIQWSTNVQSFSWFLGELLICTVDGRGYRLGLQHRPTTIQQHKDYKTFISPLYTSSKGGLFFENVDNMPLWLIVKSTSQLINEKILNSPPLTLPLSRPFHGGVLKFITPTKSLYYSPRTARFPIFINTGYLLDRYSIGMHTYVAPSMSGPLLRKIIEDMTYNDTKQAVLEIPSGFWFLSKGQLNQFYLEKNISKNISLDHIILSNKICNETYLQTQLDNYNKYQVLEIADSKSMHNTSITQDMLLLRIIIRTTFFKETLHTVIYHQNKKFVLLPACISCCFTSKCTVGLVRDSYTTDSSKDTCIEIYEFLDIEKCEFFENPILVASFIIEDSIYQTPRQIFHTPICQWPIFLLWNSFSCNGFLTSVCTHENLTKIENMQCIYRTPESENINSEQQVLSCQWSSSVAIPFSSITSQTLDRRTLKATERHLVCFNTQSVLVVLSATILSCPEDINKDNAIVWQLIVQIGTRVTGLHSFDEYFSSGWASKGDAVCVTTNTSIMLLPLLQQDTDYSSGLKVCMARKDHSIQQSITRLEKDLTSSKDNASSFFVDPFTLYSCVGKTIECRDLSHGAYLGGFVPIANVQDYGTRIVAILSDTLVLLSIKKSKIMTSSINSELAFKSQTSIIRLRPFSFLHSALHLILTTHQDNGESDNDNIAVFSNICKTNPTISPSLFCSMSHEDIDGKLSVSNNVGHIMPVSELSTLCTLYDAEWLGAEMLSRVFISDNGNIKKFLMFSFQESLLTYRKIPFHFQQHNPYGVLLQAIHAAMSTCNNETKNVQDYKPIVLISAAIACLTATLADNDLADTSQFLLNVEPDYEDEKQSYSTIQDINELRHNFANKISKCKDRFQWFYLYFLVRLMLEAKQLNHFIANSSEKETFNQDAANLTAAFCAQNAFLPILERITGIRLKNFFSIDTSIDDITIQSIRRLRCYEYNRPYVDSFLLLGTNNTKRGAFGAPFFTNNDSGLLFPLLQEIKLIFNGIYRKDLLWPYKNELNNSIQNNILNINDFIYKYPQYLYIDVFHKLKQRVNPISKPIILRTASDFNDQVYLKLPDLSENCSIGELYGINSTKNYARKSGKQRLALLSKLNKHKTGTILYSVFDKTEYFQHGFLALSAKEDHGLISEINYNNVSPDMLHNPGLLIYYPFCDIPTNNSNNSKLIFDSSGCSRHSELELKDISENIINSLINLLPIERENEWGDIAPSAISLILGPNSRIIYNQPDDILMNLIGEKLQIDNKNNIQNLWIIRQKIYNAVHNQSSNEICHDITQSLYDLNEYDTSWRICFWVNIHFNQEEKEEEEEEEEDKIKNLYLFGRENEWCFVAYIDCNEKQYDTWNIKYIKETETIKFTSCFKLPKNKGTNPLTGWVWLCFLYHIDTFRIICSTHTAASKLDTSSSQYYKPCHHDVTHKINQEPSNYLISDYSVSYVIPSLVFGGKVDAVEKIKKKQCIFKMCEVRAYAYGIDESSIKSKKFSLKSYTAFDVINAESVNEVPVQDVKSKASVQSLVETDIIIPPRMKEKLLARQENLTAYELLETKVMLHKGIQSGTVGIKLFQGVSSRGRPLPKVVLEIEKGIFKEENVNNTSVNRVSGPSFPSWVLEKPPSTFSPLLVERYLAHKLLTVISLLKEGAALRAQEAIQQGIKILLSFIHDFFFCYESANRTISLVCYPKIGVDLRGSCFLFLLQSFYTYFHVSRILSTIKELENLDIEFNKRGCIAALWFFILRFPVSPSLLVKFILKVQWSNYQYKLYDALKCVYERCEPNFKALGMSEKDFEEITILFQVNRINLIKEHLHVQDDLKKKQTIQQVIFGQCPNCFQNLEPLQWTCFNCFASLALCHIQLKICEKKGLLLCPICRCSIEKSIIYDLKWKKEHDISSLCCFCSLHSFVDYEDLE